MPPGIYSDFKIYNEQYYGGQFEVIAQMLEVLNAASRGAIRLVAHEHIGHFRYESFIKDIGASLITRRDISSVSGATSQKVEQGEFIGVKVNRKIGPVEQSLDAWRKIAKDAEEMSYVVGQQVAQRKLADYVNTGILAIEAAIEGQAALNFDATGETTKTLIHTHLVDGLAKMGDAATRIVCWIMHSKPFFDLTKAAITDKITNVADAVIYGATPATLGRPVVVTDAPALHDDNGSLTDTYNVLGLAEGALVLEESELEDLISEIVTGLENLVFRIQGEYAYTINCLGFAWDVSGGGVNPLDTAIGTTTNWDKAKTDNKDLAGVRIVVE